MKKVPRFISDIATVITIMLLMSVAGWICSESGIMGNYPPTETGFVLDVTVIDQNGTILPNQTVYAIACLQKPAGWTTPTQYVSNASLSGTTGKEGYGEIVSGNYTLARGDIVWLGVSTDRALLESDYANRSFSPGKIGKWSSFTYSYISRPGPPVVKYGTLIMIRNSDGRMIDINQFNTERGFLFPPDRQVEYFTYMDNHSWTYTA